MQVNAGLVTGNVATVSADHTSSGGVQNLVRYMEDWSGKNTTFKGSVGRLFGSTQFVHAYTGPGSEDLTAVHPSTRSTSSRPARSVSTAASRPTRLPQSTTTAFGRGDFFNY